MADKYNALNIPALLFDDIGGTLQPVAFLQPGYGPWGSKEEAREQLVNIFGNISIVPQAYTFCIIDASGKPEEWWFTRKGDWDTIEPKCKAGTSAGDNVTYTVTIGDIAPTGYRAILTYSGVPQTVTAGQRVSVPRGASVTVTITKDGYQPKVYTRDNIQDNWTIPSTVLQPVATETRTLTIGTVSANGYPSSQLTNVHLYASYAGITNREVSTGTKIEVSNGTPVSITGTAGMLFTSFSFEYNWYDTITYDRTLDIVFERAAVEPSFRKLIINVTPTAVQSDCHITVKYGNTSVDASPGVNIPIPKEYTSVQVIGVATGYSQVVSPLYVDMSQPDENNTVRAELAFEEDQVIIEFGTLTISSCNVPGATIKVNGGAAYVGWSNQYVGGTEVTVTAEKEGYKPYSNVYTVPPGGNMNAVIRMEEVAPEMCSLTINVLPANIAAAITVYYTGLAEPIRAQSGVAIPNIPKGTGVTFAISASGYQDLTNQMVTVDETNKVVERTLTPAQYTAWYVKPVVTSQDTGDALPNATVTVSYVNTNAEPVTGRILSYGETVRGVLDGTDFRVQVVCEGYTTYDQTFNITHNYDSLPIQMSAKKLSLTINTNPVISMASETSSIWCTVFAPEEYLSILSEEELNAMGVPRYRIASGDTIANLMYKARVQIEVYAEGYESRTKMYTITEDTTDTITLAQLQGLYVNTVPLNAEVIIKYGTYNYSTNTWTRVDKERQVNDSGEAISVPQGKDVLVRGVKEGYVEQSLPVFRMEQNGKEINIALEPDTTLETKCSFTVNPYAKVLCNPRGTYSDTSISAYSNFVRYEYSVNGGATQTYISTEGVPETLPLVIDNLDAGSVVTGFAYLEVPAGASGDGHVYAPVYFSTGRTGTEMNDYIVSATIIDGQIVNPGGSGTYTNNVFSLRFWPMDVVTVILGDVTYSGQDNLRIGVGDINGISASQLSQVNQYAGLTRSTGHNYKGEGTPVLRFYKNGGASATNLRIVASRGNSSTVEKYWDIATFSESIKIDVDFDNNTADAVEADILEFASVPSRSPMYVKYTYNGETTAFQVDDISNDGIIVPHGAEVMYTANFSYTTRSYTNMDVSLSGPECVVFLMNGPYRIEIDKWYHTSITAWGNSLINTLYQPTALTINATPRYAVIAGTCGSDDLTVDTSSWQVNNVTIPNCSRCTIITGTSTFTGTVSASNYITQNITFQGVNNNNSDTMQVNLEFHDE